MRAMFLASGRRSFFARVFSRACFLRARALCLVLAAAVATTPAGAAVTIHLASGEWKPINIEIEPFAGETGIEHFPSQIVGEDLARSGAFRAHHTTVARANIDAEAFAEARAQAREYLLAGSVFEAADGDLQIEYRLYDTVTETQLGGYQLRASRAQIRHIVHKYISNWIYETITGKAGVFHTKIAYVLKNRQGRSELQVSDYDGYDAQTVFQNNESIISPTWSPDGNELLYVSFEKRRPVVYRQSLLTGRREVVAGFSGNNSAPALSPDRRTVAAALSKDGGTQIFLVATDAGTVRRLRHSDGIDTEPDFSPDGERIIFTSDESGSTQLYEIAVDGGRARRLSFGYTYNASPQYASDGKSAFFLARTDAGFNVAWIDIETQRIEPLTAIGLADSPSPSPNDEMVIFRDERQPRYLFTTSINGKVSLRWRKLAAGEIKDPAWGPLTSDWY